MTPLATNSPAVQTAEPLGASNGRHSERKRLTANANNDSVRTERKVKAVPNPFAKVRTFT